MTVTVFGTPLNSPKPYSPKPKSSKTLAACEKPPRQLSEDGARDNGLPAKNLFKFCSDIQGGRRSL